MNKKMKSRWRSGFNGFAARNKRPALRFLSLLVALIFVSSSGYSVAEAQAFQVSGACSRDFAKCNETEREWLQVTALCHRYPQRCTYASRFSAYQPNYAIYQYTAHDENAMEVRYSFRYLFSRPHCMPQKLRDESDSERLQNPFRYQENLPDLHCLMSFAKRNEYFFTYTGQFDFYLFSRDSGPVINRISNPAIHYRKNFENLGFDHLAVKWLSVSLEHRSNGQVISADNRVNDSGSVDNGRLQTEVEYQKGNYRYFDALSRNSNYVALETKLNIGRDTRDAAQCVEAPDCVTLWLSAKLFYFGLEDNVNWGPDAAKNPSLADYDMLRIVLNDQYLTSHSGFPEFIWGLEWTLGKQLLDTDSLDLHVTFPSVITGGYKIPWFIRAHFGPMNNLSDYTRAQNSIGIGVRFD